ncbi:TonB-dependent receptor [Brevundimonas diminuta]|nr:TonB-dependent receptor [Brevundimonas diminuta]
MREGLRRILHGTNLEIAADQGNVIILRARDAVRDNVSQEAISTVDEILVTASPIVGSQTEAIRRQRAASNVINVAASDQVGQFPDQSAAAALSRLPGTAVQRDQGQERYVQVRGAPDRWSSVSIDGLQVNGVDEDGGARTFRFDGIPAAILSSLEINKSITPDLPGDAIVAQINLRTASPFDRRGLTGLLSAGSGRFDLGGGALEQYSGRLSWSGERFGVLVAGSHYLREQVTDNREFRYDADGVPTWLDFRSYRLSRESNAGMAAVEYRPNDQNTFFAKFIYTEYVDNEGRDMYIFDLGSAAGGTRGRSGGDLVGVPVYGGFNSGVLATSNRVTMVGGDHEADAWRASWRAGHVHTRTETILPAVGPYALDPARAPSVRYDLSNPDFPIVSLASTEIDPATGRHRRGAERDTFDLDAFSLVMANPLTTDVPADTWIGRADVTRDFDGQGPLRAVNFGGQYSDGVIDGWAVSYGNSAVLSALLPLIGRSFSIADYDTGRPWATNFPLGFRFNALDLKRMTRDLLGHLDALEAAGLYDPSRNVSPENRYRIEDRLGAVYGSLRFSALGGDIVAGARIEHHDQSIAGFVVAGGVASPLSASRSETDVFPSVNARFDLTDDIVLRLSAQAGIARPSFGAIRTGASVDDLNRTVSGGNPNLNPERTVGGDASLERYLGSNGILSASAFYRRVRDVLYQSVSTVSDGAYDHGGVDRRGYEFHTTLNGGNGSLYGIEFAYAQPFPNLPGWLDGLGLQANVAFLGGEFELGDGRKSDFPGTSKVIANTSLFYENHRTSLRLSYQWRDDWVNTFGFAGDDVWQKATENLDFSARYAFTDHVIGFLDVNNLTDEHYVVFSGQRSRPLEVEQIGRSWMAGVRLVF